MITSLVFPVGLDAEHGALSLPCRYFPYRGAQHLDDLHSKIQSTTEKNQCFREIIHGMTLAALVFVS
jgi:hypothetical protein